MRTPHIYLWFNALIDLFTSFLSPKQVLENINPTIDLQYEFKSFSENDGSEFIQVEIGTMYINTILKS